MRNKGVCRLSLRALPVLAFLSLFAAGSAPAQEAAGISAASVEPAVTVAITDAGFVPDEVTVVPGQAVHWTNESADDQSVTAENGVFDSGPIPAGGGFSMALDVAATHVYSSSGDPDFAGSVQVVLEELPGAPDEPAEEHIPDIPFPPVAEDDLGEHPDLMVLAHRSHLLVGFVEGATVAEANAALDAAGTPIVGGLPDLGVVLVAAPDTPDFSGLVTAVETLRAHPAVQFAALDAELTTSSLPRAAEAITETFPNAPWVWDPDLPEAIGMGGNWGLEASRFPQAWNLLEPIKRTANAVQTGILDEGFNDGHPDLANVLQTEQLCRAPGFGLMNCTLNVRSADHGNHVAGTIGGEFDNTSSVLANRSLGVSGANPVADMHGVPAFLPTPLLPAFFGNGMELWELFLETADPSSLSVPRLPNLRVINYSMGFEPPGEYDSCLDDDDSDGAGCEGFSVTPGAAENSCDIHPRTRHTLLGDIDCDGGEQLEWWDSHPNQVCGPGGDDDGVPGTGWCTPNNEDGWLEEMAEWGEAAREVAERASELGVAIVQAAGNSSGSYFASFCPPSGGACSPVLYAGTTAQFGWASDHWTATTPNPIFVVEAIGPGLARADFSNVRDNAPRLPCPRTSCAYVAAPGEVVLSSVGGGTYADYQGTSMAAPHVTGLISYLLAYDSSLELDDVRNAVMQWAREDTTGGAQPRIDAFASILSLPGAAKALVDVNDPSKDGNRRRILGPFGTPLGDDTKLSATPDSRTDPDGRIDMRDFRRFRDAWLLASGNGGDLNGSTHHVKKDLNFDGCTHVEGDDSQDCSTPERAFSRFDFNGDGEILLTSESKVPLEADGTPAATRLDATLMTDLEVLASQWETDPALAEGTEGWTQADLNEDLMQSGDLEIHAEDFFAAGAEEVEIEVKADGTALPPRTLKKSDEFTDVDGERRNFIVVTVPASPANVEVTATATVETPGGDTETLESPAQEVTLEFGEDKRLDICGLALEADPKRVPADGEATSAIEATLGENCPVDSVEGKTVFFTVEPAGTGHGSVNPTGLSTDENGVATTTFTAGTIPAAYTITATADLGDGQEAKGSVTVETLPPLRIHYLWRQTNVSWSESGTTRWAPLPGMPDCTTAVDYCIDSFSLGPHPTMPSLGFERAGVLSGADDSFELSEEVLESLNRSRRTWTKSNPDGSNVASGTEDFAWSVIAADLERYQEHVLPATVSVEDRPEGLILRGLKAVGELGYRHSLVGTFRDPPDVVAPIELHATRGELLLAPRGDGSALRFAVDTSRPIAFERNLDDTFQPYQFCGTFTKDLTTQPGYRVADSSEWVPGATDLTRKTTYAPGDRPMPVGPGSLTVRYAFAAVATYSPDPPDVVLPDCSQNNPPDADFDYMPLAPKEGRVVRFFDRSTDPENNISTWNWTFGNGETSAAQDPHLLYHDDGDYNVGLRVEDTEGAADGPETKLVSVANEPPEAGLDDATGQVGTAIGTSFRLWDPARADQASIGYELKRTDTGAVLASSAAPAGRYTLTFPAGFFSSAGSYPFTLTATDKDAASASDTATITVTQDPPPPPPPEDPPTPTCDPTVTLDEQEQAFVEEVNAYRAENGLDPVVASPSLTRASERHVDDMVENDFIAHDGSDGSTPAQRATAAGYPSQSTGENLAFDFETAVDVLLGWKSSQTGHNENMLNPGWKAIGLARAEGPTEMPPDPPHDAWWWATLYGDVVDCPAPASATSLSSVTGGSKAMVLSSAGGGGGVAADEGKLESETVAPPPLEAEPAEILRVSESAFAATLAAASVAPALAAFTISDVTPVAGVPVTLTNRSRDVAGDPIAATLDLGDGTPDALEPGGSVQITFPAGTFDITLSLSGEGTLAVTRTLAVAAPPPQPPPGPAPQGPPPDTVGPTVGIATAAVTASKTGAVPVRLTCPAGETLCTGTLTLRSKGKIRIRPALERLVQVTFGRKAFTLQGGQTAPVTVKLSRKNRALLARLKKVRVVAIVEARDAAGNLQTTQVSFLLRAPKRS